jgi:hypothetical protein
VHQLQRQLRARWLCSRACVCVKTRRAAPPSGIRGASAEMARKTRRHSPQEGGGVALGCLPPIQCAQRSSCHALGPRDSCCFLAVKKKYNPCVSYYRVEQGCLIWRRINFGGVFRESRMHKWCERARYRAPIAIIYDMLNYLCTWLPPGVAFFPAPHSHGVYLHRNGPPAPSPHLRHLPILHFLPLVRVDCTARASPSLLHCAHSL